MLNKLTPLALGIMFAFPSWAQFEVGTGTEAPPASPDLLMPAGKTYVKRDSIPPPRVAKTTERSEIGCTGPYGVGCADGDDLDNAGTTPKRNYYDGPGGFDEFNGGSFRINCTFSHASFDDPIIYYRQSGRSHLHQFFGNTGTDGDSDPALMGSSGDSTCKGGHHNRTAYWVPTILYSCPPPGDGTCDPLRDGEVVVAGSANFYYKIAQNFHSSSGGYGGTPAQWPPVGFRFIAGNPSNVTSTLNGARFWFQCFNNPGASPAALMRTGHIPSTADVIADGRPCYDLETTVAFMECWDGVNLDVPNHGIENGTYSHVAEADYYGGCTDPDYPILFPTITLNMHTIVPDIADLSYWRLSSDPSKAEAIALYPAFCTSANNYCAGRSTHADWAEGWKRNDVNGWGMTVPEAILQECYGIGLSEALVLGVSPRHVDCHDDLLGSPLGDGNWWRLD